MSAVFTKDELPTLDISQTKNPPFYRLVGVELRKSYDTRSGFWLLLIMGAVTLLIDGIFLLVAATTANEFPYGAFVGNVTLVMTMFLPVLGILLVTSEWSQRTTLTTFALNPHRLRVVVAKLCAGLLLTLAVAAFSLLSGVVANLLEGAITGSLEWDLPVKGFIGLILWQLIAMLIGFALGTFFLNSPAAIVLFFVIFLAMPMALGLMSFISFVADLQPWINLQVAMLPLIDNMSFHGKEWAHFAVAMLIWVVVPLAIGIWRVLRAEVK